jgi:hypothetical protein
MGDNGPEELGDIFGVMCGIKKSIIATCAFNVRLKRVNPAQRSSGYRAMMTNDAQQQQQHPSGTLYELGFTLTDVYFQGYTDMASPQIISSFASNSLRVPYKAEDANDMVTMLQQIRIREEQDVGPVSSINQHLHRKLALF